MNMENEIKELLDAVQEMIGAQSDTFQTAEGDRVAVVTLGDVISVGILESDNNRIANAVFTPTEAESLARKLMEYANSI